MRRFGLSGAAAAVVVACGAFAGAASAAAGTTVVLATLSSSGHLTSTFSWTVQKSADPGSQLAAVGGSGSVKYTIDATKSAHGTQAAFLSGNVCVGNAGLVPTQGLAIAAALTWPPSSAVLSTVAVDVSSRPVLGALSHHCYPYTIHVPAGAIVPSGAYKLVAHVTILNELGHVGSLAGPSPAATRSLPKTASVIDGQVTVNDTNGQNFTFAATGTRTYNQSFPCPTAAGAHIITHDNTATIHSTGQAANAQATIHCATPNTLTNSLSANTIFPNQSASDQATITGANPTAGGRIAYKVYTDNTCHTLFADATPTTNTVNNATAPPSKPITFDNRGTYYWQATYTGDPDTNTLDATSSCTPITVKGWQTADLTTYTQISWTTTPGSTTLSSNFNSIYSSGSVEVGGPFTMDFTTANHVVAYLPAAGISSCAHRKSRRPDLLPVRRIRRRCPSPPARCRLLRRRTAPATRAQVRRPHTLQPPCRDP